VSTVVESSLRARIAALAEAEPGLADDLALRGALIEIVDHADLDAFELRLPADIARARLTSGVPLLDRLDLPVPPSTATLFERLTVGLLADPAARQPAEAMLTALRGHRLHAEQLVGEAVVGHDDHLTALAESADAAQGLVVWVADLAARALLESVARRLRPALSLAPWVRGYCPVCGGRPIFGEAAEGREEGPALRCGRCAAAWAHRLQGCPDCQTGRLAVPETQDVPELGRWALAGCDTCRAYLKIAPSPRAGRLADLLVDDLATWHLDRRAAEQGRERQSGTGYRLEHGEPGGEELDDD
jgi:FdhE protein